MRLDFRPQFHFSQLEVSLLLARVLIFFRLLVLQAPVVGYLADRGLGRRRDLDEVQPGSPGTRERIFGREYPELISAFVYDPNRTDADLIVYAQGSCYELISK